MGDGQFRTIIFIVTKECQFRCRYCYLVEKNSYEVMPTGIGKSAVDYILSNPEFEEDSVILDFIGGEPLIEIKRIEEICGYFVKRAEESGHRWSTNYTIRITTNGLLYNKKEVQEFLTRYNEHISVSISLDGTKRKNDTNRVFVSGKGTYDSIINNVKLWIRQYPESESRMTISHDDLPFVKESVLHLLELGIKNIDVRIVNEDVWKDGDDIIYEKQLISLADYLVSKESLDCHLSCFHEEKGMPISDNVDISCGNKVIAIDSLGNLYPCHRFASYSLRTKSPLIIGDVFNGIDKNKMRAFACFDVRTHNSKECNECNICGDCRFCLAEDYDSAETNTIYQHSKAICKMHKAEVRAYNYYWRLYNQNHRIMTDNELKSGGTKPWKEGVSKSVTFIVTKDCQLACKYCYLVGKNNQERMSFETAKKAVDYILDNEQMFEEESVIWDFIGGEPLIEVELIDRISDYIKLKMYEMNHHWFNAYRFNLTTNGINYNSKAVQRYVEKNHNHLNIVITIDGTEKKHNINRIYKDGRGSYQDVVKNIPLWLSQFPQTSTKVTISSADIPYIKESVMHLYELGIKEVNINCVFENVWNDGDDILFEQQLIELADWIIENDYYLEYNCSFYDWEHLGKPLDPNFNNQNWCGAGRMLSVDAAGNFYPCTRFAKYSLREKKPIIIGNIHDGINANLLRPFLTLDRTTQSPQKCLDCEVASGCAWCQGENYDAAATDTIYERATAICLMHKARVRANNYYWNKLYRKLELKGISQEDASKHIKQTTNNEIC